MISAYLAEKYDRLLSYYISQVVEDCLDPLPTPTFISYIEMLYELDQKQTIKNKYKISLSRILIKEFSNQRFSGPLIVDKFGVKALLENAKEKASLLSINKSSETDRSRSRSGVEIHDIYSPDFTFDSEEVAKKWLESSMLNSHYSPFNDSISEISVKSSDTDKTMSYNEIVVQTLHMLSFNASTHIMDRKKTLKPGVNNSAVMAGDPRRSMKKMVSLSKIGIKSLLVKETEHITEKRDRKKAESKNSGIRLKYLLDNSEIKEETAKAKRRSISNKHEKHSEQKSKIARPGLPLAKIKESTLRHYQSVTAFERVKGVANNLDNILKNKGSFTRILGLSTTKRNPQALKPKPSSQINDNLLNKKRSVSRNYTSTKNLPKAAVNFVGQIISQVAPLERHQKEPNAAKLGVRKFVKSCDKVNTGVRDDFASLLVKTEKANKPLKLAPQKPKKILIDTRKPFKDIRELFWKKLNLELK